MNSCEPQDIAIKSFFLGPQAENADWLREKWIEILDNWIRWRRSIFPHDGNSISEADRNTPAFLEALRRLETEFRYVLKVLEDETPKFTPRYLGHMVSEVSLPAILGHVCALLHNPNNTSREVSRVTSRLEEEAIADLAEMLGFDPKQACGHFTSGGTIANFEALWRAIVRMDRSFEEKLHLSPLKLGPWVFAREYKNQTGHQFEGPVVLVPNNKHFSWEKAVSLMGLGEEALWPVALDRTGRLSTDDLRAKLELAAERRRQVMLVVSVAGTTEMGEVDPITEVQDILDLGRERGLDIWHHVDAAYGGYYTAMLDGDEVESKLNARVGRDLRAIRRVDSVTLDPHKLGYVPYACGAFIARDHEHYRVREFQATYLMRENNSRWVTTLEGSRSGAGVTATWLANRALGLNAAGYGRLLAKGIEARDSVLHELQSRAPEFLVVDPVDLNVLCFCFAPWGMKVSEINNRTEDIFRYFESSPCFSVSKTVLHAQAYGALLERLASERQLQMDQDHWFMLRLVLMNPFVTSKESKTAFVEEFVIELLNFSRK
ncbi:MAG: aspartate aminotransferase family protein [Bdellovibrionales bacterium]